MEKLKMIVSMVIFGTIGIFVQYTPLSSTVIACVRSVIGALFLAAVILVTGKKPNIQAIKKNWILLLLSGGALGFNWICLFEAYRYTTVAVATLCYYMAPVFVIILSPIVLKERLTALKILCTAAAVAGIILISGGGGGSAKGIALGLAAAMMYCAILLMNKKMEGIDALEKTLCQLSVSAVVMVVYTLITQDLSEIVPNTVTIVMALVLGIVHTGIAYILFFGSVGKLPAQTSAVLSYIDPVTAIVLSALFLKQPMSAVQIGGAVLILGSMFANELLPNLRKKPRA